MRPLLTLLLVFVVLDVLSLFWAAKIIGGLAVFGLLLLAFVAGSSLLGGGRLSRHFAVSRPAAAAHSAGRFAAADARLSF